MVEYTVRVCTMMISPPPFFFNHLVTVVPFTFIRVNYIIRPSLCFCFGDVATTRKK
jgi:hypothetical protein